MLVRQIVPMSAATVYDGEFIHRFHHLQQVLTHMAAQKLHSFATALYQPVCDVDGALVRRHKSWASEETRKSGTKTLASKI